MKTISVNVPEAFVSNKQSILIDVKGLEELVRNGLYANRSEAIRVAIRDLLKKELYNHELSFTPTEKNNEKYIKEQQIVTI